MHSPLTSSYGTDAGLQEALAVVCMAPMYTMQSNRQTVNAPNWCAYIAELLLAHDMVSMTPVYAIQSKVKTANAPLMIEASTASILDAVSDAMSPSDTEMLRFFRLNRDRGGPGERRTVAGFSLSPFRCCRSPSSPTGTESDKRRPDQ